ncbi:MAG TPA: Zn-dependent hydrolase [Bryobacteraceae bacterium]
MPFDASAFSSRERKMLSKLVDASRYLERIYWLQSDPEGLKLLEKTRDAKLRRLLMINGSRFDLIDGNRSFTSTEPYAPGGGLYPFRLTRADIESYAARHPEKRAELYSPYTVIRRKGDELAGVPYRQEYRRWLEPAARALRDAAALSADSAFAHFLRLRADALLSDDYYPSDLAWLELRDPKFDIIFAPYETYLDGILGVKTSYGAAILVRDGPQSRKLATFERYIPDLQEALPLDPADRPSKRGHATPMEVAVSPLRSGDLRHGYQAVADNLPNDPRIQAEKGSKKIFFKNFLDARVDSIVAPLAAKLMLPAQARMVTPEAYLSDTLLHEISHGLGPAFARRGGKQVDIREALGSHFPAVEEAKADVVGLFAAEWLAGRGVLTPRQLSACYAAHVADLFRMLRFGTAEAHAVSEIMQFSYLVERKAIAWDPASSRYSVDFARMPDAIEELAQELLEIEAAGDAARAGKWFARYEALPPGTANALAAAAGLPVDVDPVFAIRDMPR